MKKALLMLLSMALVESIHPACCFPCWNKTKTVDKESDKKYPDINKAVAENLAEYYLLYSSNSSPSSSRSSSLDSAEKEAVQILDELDRALEQQLVAPLSIEAVSVFSICRPRKGKSQNQDRYLVDEEKQVFAVFDGHGAEGHVVAEEAKISLNDWLQHNFIESKEDMHSVFSAMRERIGFNCDGGSTALVVAINSVKKLVCGWLGDCELAVQQEDSVVFPAPPHDITNSAEIKRVQPKIKGGKAFLQDGYLCSVLLQGSGKSNALQNFRALGDKLFTHIGVIDDPQVEIFDCPLKGGETVVLATDGIIRQLQDLDKDVELARKVFAGLIKKYGDSEAGATNIAREALELVCAKYSEDPDSAFYKDDTTLVIAKIKKDLKWEEGQVFEV